MMPVRQVGVIGRWNDSSSKSISQKVFGKVKPDTPLKNRIGAAQEKLGQQIAKLDSIHGKLQKKHDALFNKVVACQRTNNHACARAYANELAQVKKIRDMVGGAKLSIERVQVRLNTVSQLGDVMVTLSPCMSVIKDLSGSLGGIMPEASSSMQNMSEMLDGIITGSTVSGGEAAAPASVESNAETRAILEEAHAVIEGRVKSNLPDLPPDLPDLPAPPENLKQDIVERREAYG